MINLVELCADEEEQSETPCAFGNLVDEHAVYCHNDGWADGPRKCRRTWYTGGRTRDEDCPGFKANPNVPRGSEQWIDLRWKKRETQQASEAPAETAKDKG